MFFTGKDKFHPTALKKKGNSLKIIFLFTLIFTIFLTSCSSNALVDSPKPDQPPETGGGKGLPLEEGKPGTTSTTAAGGTLTTYIQSSGIGDIAVQVSLPSAARYQEGAGIVVEVNTFLTPGNNFYSSVDLTTLGLIHVSYLWPGISAPSGEKSDGQIDYGGKRSIQALRDVILFASGDLPNKDGFYLDELVSIQPLYDNLGIYAFSHPGLAAVNVLAQYGDDLEKVGYFVGRENPTLDKLTAVEVGYFDNDNTPVLNPLYEYPDGYQSTDISMDYSSIAWDRGMGGPGSKWNGSPYFDLNRNGELDSSDHILGSRIPTANNKRLYSVELTKALKENDVFRVGGWPDDLSTLSEARQIWKFNNSTSSYPDVGRKMPDLKVMLVFAQFDHVQPAVDKPHIHHAYDGFRKGAKLWVRLNPDQSYVSSINADFGAGYRENSANEEPTNWLSIEEWGHSNRSGGSQMVPLAAIAEMADRLYSNDWSEDLESILE